MDSHVVDGWTVPGFTHLKELGVGAGGRVMLALDDVTQTKVVIKYLDARLGGDGAFLAAFRPVARRLSQLEDPNVVDFYEFVETDEGTAVVMERVEGLGLRRLLAAQGPTGPLAALAMVSGSLLGLAAAHAKDIAHGTLRPSEILIDGDGNCRVGDYALARAGTEAQTIPSYAAPELWDGAPAGVAADLYAITAIFFECLTGRPPYSGRNASALGRQHREAPIPVEAVPGPLRELITLGLSKDPSARPSSAADFLGAVEDAAVDAYGPAWLAQGRGRLAELAEQAARQPEPPPAKTKAPKPKPPKPAKAPKAAAPAASMAQPAPPPAAAPADVTVPPGPAPVPAYPPGPAPDPAPRYANAPGPGPGPAPGGRGRGRSLVIAAALAVVVIAGSTAGAALFLERRNQTAPPPTPANSDLPVPATPVGPSKPAAALASRIQQATGQTAAAAFTYRRTGCCGAATNARGTLKLVPSGPASYSMAVAGSGDTRRSARAIVVGGTVYVRFGSTWRPAPADGQAPGYPALAAQARWGSSVGNVVALLNNSASFEKDGQVYRGTVPIDRLTRLPEVGPLYSHMVSVSGARQVMFALKLDRAGRPAHLWFRTRGKEKARQQTVSATYAGWGRKVTIAVPNGR